MLTRLQNWMSLVEVLRLAFTTSQPRRRKSKLKAIAEPSKALNDIALPPHATRAAEVTRNDILSLRRAFRHTTISDLHTILANAELLSFSASLFSQVSPFSPSWLITLILHTGNH
jgi:hypothetical protein